MNEPVKGHRKRLRPGQPSAHAKLDNQLERKLCRLIAEGLSYETVCDLAGVARSTFYAWIERGEAQPGSRYGAFARAVKAANAQAIRTLHLEVKRSNPAWILERRFPELYGPPRSRVEMMAENIAGLPQAMAVNVVIERKNDDDRIR